jgi:ATP adenylyltransferase
VGLDRFAASWRESYVTSPEASANARDEGDCVFCSLLLRGVGIDSGILWQDEHSFIVLNAFPYGSGHLLALPNRHVASFADLNVVEYTALALAQRRMVTALERAYQPDGLNVGANLGRAAGAGIPKHLHLHALPRWSGDTNFMSTIGETRVLSESLESTWNKVSQVLATMGPDDPSVD